MSFDPSQWAIFPSDVSPSDYGPICRAVKTTKSMSAEDQNTDSYGNIMLSKENTFIFCPDSLNLNLTKPLSDKNLPDRCLLIPSNKISDLKLVLTLEDIRGLTTGAIALFLSSMLSVAR